MNTTLRLAIFDLYDRYPNKGMESIHEIIRNFSQYMPFDITFEVFDVRAENQVPDLSFDLYIATGGPGSPIESIDSDWEKNLFASWDAILAHNARPETLKKPLFLICHSFQLFCRHYGFGEVSARYKESFGVYPTHRQEDREPFFAGLPRDFWIADFRKYQVLNLNEEKLAEWGGKLLCLEKERPHIDFDPAIMAIRFNDWTFGTQFHPEGEAEGMLYWFGKEEKKNAIINAHGQDKYDDMVFHLRDPEKIALTHSTILPNFLNHSTQYILDAKRSPQYV